MNTPDRELPSSEQSENQQPEGAEVSSIQHAVGDKVEAVGLAADQQKLIQLRESGELSPHDFDLNTVFMLNDNNLPLTRDELGNQALVLSREDFETLGFITILHKSGEEMTIDAESMIDDVFIIFPGDLG